MPDWKEININAGLLIALVVGTATILTAIVSFQWWDDTRNRSAIESYANEHINPRIRANERNIESMRKDMKEIQSMIQQQENSRDRQYGHLKKQQNQIIDILSDVRDLGIRK